MSAWVYVRQDVILVSSFLLVVSLRAAGRLVGGEEGRSRLTQLQVYHPDYRVPRPNAESGEEREVKFRNPKK